MALSLRGASVKGKGSASVVLYMYGIPISKNKLLSGIFLVEVRSTSTSTSTGSIAINSTFAVAVT